MPHLKELVELHKDDPFALIGINDNDTPESYAKGVKDFGVTWLSAFEGNETTISDLYSVHSFPTYIVLDVDGKIAFRTSDPGQAKEVDKVVAKLLAKKKRAEMDKEKK